MLLIAFLAACKKDKLVPQCDGSNPTYTSKIRSIIKSNCTTGGCHSSYTTYAGLNSILQNGTFERVVLADQSMPQGGSLTQDELNKLQCWADNGFPE